jgi:hypothetical protein
LDGEVDFVDDHGDIETLNIKFEQKRKNNKKENKLNIDKTKMKK